MFPQIPYAQYGSPRAYYGNIQYGAAPKLFQVYGAWPEERPVQDGMLVGDWQTKNESGAQEMPPARAGYAEEIAARIEIIRNLKAQVDEEHELKAKNQLREQLRIEREAKERAFKLKALVEEEESLFILLN